MIEDKVSSLEMRLISLEGDIALVKAEIDAMKTGAEERSLMVMRLTGEVSDMRNSTDTILAFVTGANKVVGIAAKHWRTAIIFGAGVMTSAGFGNPAMWDFIKTFVGG